MRVLKVMSKQNPTHIDRLTGYRFTQRAGNSGKVPLQQLEVEVIHDHYMIILHLLHLANVIDCDQM